MGTLPVGAPPVQRFSHTSRKLGVLHGRGADKQGGGLFRRGSSCALCVTGERVAGCSGEGVHR
ncbi:hypothetical protein K270103H11_04890 [Gordonibacter urolithinfaciens]